VRVAVRGRGSEEREREAGSEKMSQSAVRECRKCRGKAEKAAAGWKKEGVGRCQAEGMGKETGRQRGGRGAEAVQAGRKARGWERQKGRKQAEQTPTPERGSEEEGRGGGEGEERGRRARECGRREMVAGSRRVQECSRRKERVRGPNRQVVGGPHHHHRLREVGRHTFSASYNISHLRSPFHH